MKIKTLQHLEASLRRARCAGAAALLEAQHSLHVDPDVTRELRQIYDYCVHAEDFFGAWVIAEMRKDK